VIYARIAGKLEINGERRALSWQWGIVGGYRRTRFDWSLHI